MNISHDYKIIRNIQVLQWLCKGSLGPFLAIYFTQVSGEEFAAVGIFSLLLLSTSIFEIPTGSLADKHGRLKVFLISQIFFFISLFFLHTTNGFILLGWAILSGLSEAIA
ncbi:MFS transporter, partial [Vibrio parahaemolyticus]